MKKQFSLVVGFFMVLCAAAPQAKAIVSGPTTTVEVVDSSGTALSGAQVVAMAFKDSGEPDAYLSQSALTATDGKALFVLEESRKYNILVSKQGYMPFIREQLDESSDPLLIEGTNQDQSVTVDMQEAAADFEDNYVEVKADVKIEPSYADSMVFSSIMQVLQEEWEDIAFGAVRINDTVEGLGTVNIHNVPNFLDGNYELNCFSPAMNSEWRRTFI
ncbi:MAG: carboxypeptidase-like regulatory domain-containing protein [Elusimicrobiota bacterium]